MIAGSDFPEYVPTQIRERIESLADGLPAEKRENVLFGNLSKLFETPAGWTA